LLVKALINQSPLRPFQAHQIAPVHDVIFKHVSGAGRQSTHRHDPQPCAPTPMVSILGLYPPRGNHNPARRSLNFPDHIVNPSGRRETIHPSSWSTTLRPSTEGIDPWSIHTARQPQSPRGDRRGRINRSLAMTAGVNASAAKHLFAHGLLVFYIEI